MYHSNFNLHFSISEAQQVFMFIDYVNILFNSCSCILDDFNSLINS